MQTPQSKTNGITILILGLSGLAFFALNTEFRFLGLGIGLPLIVVAIGILGKSGQYTRRLQQFVSKSVHVEIWGVPLPGSNGAVFQIDSISPMGLGVWVYMHPISGGPRLKLKIAQPTSLALTSNKAEINFAGYAQWNSRRIMGPDGQRAPGTVVIALA